jgi:hypothetical protein
MFTKEASVKHLAAILASLWLAYAVGMAAPSAETEFSTDDTTWYEENGYDVVELQGCYLGGSVPGEPNLPECGLRILIPQDMKVVSVRIDDTTSVEFEGEWRDASHIYTPQIIVQGRTSSRAIATGEHRPPWARPLEEHRCNSRITFILLSLSPTV